jgi:hypothetical protein
MAFDGLISRLNTTEERSSDFEDIPIETSKTENNRKLRTMKQLQKI